MQAETGKQYAFSTLTGDGNTDDVAVKVTSESGRFSEEIRLVMELNNQTERDLTEMAEVKNLLEKMYAEGIRPTFFVPAHQHEELALSLSAYGIDIKAPKSVHMRDLVNSAGVNSMANNVTINRVFDAKKTLITFGRTPYIDQAGYVVTVDVPLESIVPLLTGQGGAFRGVITLTVDHLDPRQIKVTQVVAPPEGGESIPEIRKRLVDDCRRLGLVA